MEREPGTMKVREETSSARALWALVHWHHRIHARSRDSLQSPELGVFCYSLGMAAALFAVQGPNIAKGLAWIEGCGH